VANLAHDDGGEGKQIILLRDDLAAYAERRGVATGLDYPARKIELFNLTGDYDMVEFLTRGSSEANYFKYEIGGEWGKGS